MSPGPYPTFVSSPLLQEERHGRERTAAGWGLVSVSYPLPPLNFTLEVRGYLEVRRDLGREMVLRVGPNEKTKAEAEKNSGLDLQDDVKDAGRLGSEGKVEISRDW